MFGFGRDCFSWSSGNSDFDSEWSEPKPFSLPSPLPHWPQGKGFATGRINLGEIEVVKITNFHRVWSSDSSHGKSNRTTFYKPEEIPEGFHCLGHYCQPTDKPLRGYILAARATKPVNANNLPPLKKPLSYTSIWSTQNGHGYFWLPNPPIGYKAMGIIVTDEPTEPKPEDVICVREDLTESCETYDIILDVKRSPFTVWTIRPCERGMRSQAVSAGTFFCSVNDLSPKNTISDIACLKNLDSNLHAMPNLDQIHSVIKHYGPTVYFHPEETYMPSSVNWFFKNGALLHRSGKSDGEPIVSSGSNLPSGGKNDTEFWIDLPEDDDEKSNLKKGNIKSAELYVHVKPALGGTLTDIAMWIFCPFNGPATLKIGLFTLPMTRIGEHVGDWEHFTFRVSNFSGELWQMFFSQHSGGGWVDASEIEFVNNKPIVYSSKHGHASFPHPGMYLQGSSKFGIGVRNDVEKSEFVLDSSERYVIVAAEYLGIVDEPCWLQYMREWGPTVTYDSGNEINKIMNLLPLVVRFSVENLVDLFPVSLYGEEGPTGPKEKDNWEGDELC